jgi:hypothetical protein
LLLTAFRYLGGFFADGLGLINGAWFGRSDGRDEKSNVLGFPLGIDISPSPENQDISALVPGTTVPRRWCSSETARSLTYSALDFSNSKNAEPEITSILSQHNRDYGYDAENDEIAFNKQGSDAKETSQHMEPHWVSIETWLKALETEDPKPDSNPQWLLHGGLNAFRYIEGFDIFIPGNCRYHFFTREQVHTYI